MPHREPIAIRAAVPSSFEPGARQPWSELDAEAAEGQGLMVSPAFWLGGAASIALWACVTLLALQWL